MKKKLLRLTIIITNLLCLIALESNSQQACLKMVYPNQPEWGYVNVDSEKD